MYYKISCFIFYKKLKNVEKNHIIEHIAKKGMFFILFNSYIFILLFLPLALAGYFILNHFKKYQLAMVWLVGMSLWFYGYFHTEYLLIICFSILINYGLSKVIHNGEKRIQKIALIVGICMNIGSIFYFKYFDFFLVNLNHIFGCDFALKNILLPLGISFFTFQQVSYLIDSYKGETKGYGFVEYALFVTFFPQLVAGPIVLHKEMIPQFQDVNMKRINADNFSEGLFDFAIGLFKKVMIADTFGKAVTWGFNTVWAMTTMETVLISLSYTFQIYFDFSGYCDMAVGIGKMFNINLPTNFDSPYKAVSIIDFWNRWHMSLTRFLREYIYFPLGGSRKGKLRTYINVMIVFLVSGIWHGANWTFILWGVLHGMAQCLNRMFQKIWNKVLVVIRWFVTFVFINCTWIIFRAESINKALEILKKLVVWDAESMMVRPELFDAFSLTEIYFVQLHCKPLSYLAGEVNGFYMWVFLLLAFGICFLGKNIKQIKFVPNIGTAVFTVVLLVWSVMSLSGISTFLYFNF